MDILKKYMLLLLLTFFSTAYSQSLPGKLIVPLGGNSWVTIQSKGGKEKVTEKGWENWQHTNAVMSSYIKIHKAGTLILNAVLNVPYGESELQWTINGISKTVKVSGKISREYKIGEWDIIQPGYIKIDARGIRKSGKLFANVSDLIIGGTSIDDLTTFVKNNEGNYYYWGRRGPSVHINYELSDPGEDIEWFYNEITVPEGNDIIGSFFMANGFGEGYFGMQVNSAKERRVLFSVWSPYDTDNPREIPEDKRIVLIRKGKGVYSGEFGDEGSGGQSYLKYNWRAGETYKFLLHAKPGENNHTSFTAYFYVVEQKKWLLIASFNRPGTNTYLKRLHSFLENFEPETGYITRKAWYHNQWVRTKSGKWKPVTKMQFSGDETAKKGYRMDYSGGEENNKFFLRNCGFFNGHTELNTKYSVTATGKIPDIDLPALK